MSAPPNALSVTRIASSQPIARASLKAASAWGGPIDITVTVPPTFSFNCKAASIPALSSGFIILGTPSLMSVFVLGSSLTSVVSGTCFAQTTIFIVLLLPHIYILVS